MKRMIIASKVTDYIDSETLHSWMQNPNFGEFTSYRQLPDMVVETVEVLSDVFQGAESSTRKRYWSFRQSPRGWKCFEANKQGFKLPGAKEFFLENK